MHSPSLPHLTSLILSSPHRKFKVHPLPCQPSVHLGISIQPEVHASTLFLVQNHLRDLRAVLTGTHPLANNLDWIYDVGKDGVVYSGQGARVRSLLGLGGARAI